MERLSCIFQVTASLSATDPSGTTNLLSAGPVNCCSAPSGGFHYIGSHTFDAVAGQTYGFTLSGSNFDTNNQVGGTFSVAAPSTFGLGALAQQVSDLEDDLADCQDANAGLTDDLNQCQSDNADLQQEVTDLNDTVVGLEDDLADCQDANAGLTDDLNQCQSDNADLQQEVTDLNGIIAGLEATIADLEDTIADLEDTIASLTSQVTELTNILTSGEADMCHKGKTITIGLDAIGAHLNHGDTLGACS